MSSSPQSPEFLSCDWGTSSFRLRLVSGGKICKEIRETSGIRALYEKSIATKHDRAELFAEFLRAQLEEIRDARQNLPLVISGMASSTIGWKELAYANAPFALDGSGLRVERLDWIKPSWLSETFLISGVATADDVMRGEETQILGIMSAPNRSALAERCVLILPGTHSKHIQIENGSVRTFRTYMTGELFDVLTQHSVLRATTDPASRIEPSQSFRDGVQTARDRGLVGSLFLVRSRGVLSKISSAENSAFLSGLLIGSELLDLKTSAPILIAASGSLGPLYAAALQIISPNSHIDLLSEVETDATTIAAHALIVARFSQV